MEKNDQEKNDKMAFLIAFLIIFPIIFGLLAIEIKIGSRQKPIKSKPKIDFERYNALVAAWDELEASDPLAKRFRPSELQTYLPKPPPSPTRPDPGVSESIRVPRPATQARIEMIEVQDRLLKRQLEMFDRTQQER